VLMAATSPPFNLEDAITQLLETTADLLVSKDNIEKRLTKIEDLINNPGWLTPTVPPVPAVLVKSTGPLVAKNNAQLLGVFVDTTGQVPGWLNTIILNQEKQMATEAQIQTAADAIVAGLAQLSTSQAALDTAVTALTTFVTNNPGMAIPDALLTELTGANTGLGTVTADLTTQAGNLTAATPAAPVVPPAP
jgi:hypothetical protein